jgi:exosome complex component RRP40
MHPSNRTKGHPARHPQVVGPGDVVMSLPESGQLRLGPGLRTHEDGVVVLKPGMLKQAKSGQIWVDGRQRR